MPIIIAANNTNCARWIFTQDEILDNEVYDNINIMIISTNQHGLFADRRSTNLFTVNDFNTRPINQLPSLNILFPNLVYLEIRYVNIQVLPQMPDILHKLVIYNTGIRCIDNLKQHPGIHTLHLEYNPMIMYKHLHLPYNLVHFQSGKQQLGIIFSPPSLTHLILYKCNVTRIQKLPITFEHEQHFHTKLRMIHCSTPYEVNVVNYNPPKSTENQVLHRYMTHPAYDSFNMMESIRKTNRELDKQFTDVLEFISFTLLNRSPVVDVNNLPYYPPFHHTSTMNYIEQVFVLGSNYPRRIMEFIVD